MSEEAGAYSVHPRLRGYAVIITNKWFHSIDEPTEDPTRYGAGVDNDNLRFIFDTKLKFQLLENKTFMDVNKSQSKRLPFWIHDKLITNKADCKCLSCKIQTTDHSGTDCFVLAISTHGVQVNKEQEIWFSDDFHDRDRLKLADIIQTLNDENCKTLMGKPRIIILNMCRSDPDVPKGKQEEVWHDGGIVQGEQIKKNITGQLEEMRLQGGAGNIPNQRVTAEVADEEYYYGTEEALRNLPPNFLIVFPCVRGRKTFHSNTHGSWLIDELKKVVDNHDFSRFSEMNFLSVLTKTAGQVAFDKESEKGKKSAVCIVHRLLKPIIFKDDVKKDENKADLEKDKPAAPGY